MKIDAEFTLKIKMNDFIVPNNISSFELKQRLLEEGEKRMRYYSSGFLLDPEGKIITKEINFKPKDE